MLATLAVITGTVTGIMVGVEFFVAVFFEMILAPLPVGAVLEARASGGRLLGRVMPFWYIVATILTVALAVATSGGTATGAAIAAAALLVVSVVMSLTILVPINNRSKAWTADDHPDDYREQSRRWQRWHYLREAVIVAAFVLTLVAATVG
jgi:hypothetical protein